MGNRLFDSVRMTRPRLNKFDLSHERKLSMNMGDLIPIMVQEIVPGDKFRVNSEVFMRVAPMLAPIMHRVNVTTHYFFVPNRLIWNEFEDFITGGRLGTTLPAVPTIVVDTDAEALDFADGKLSDYLGVPNLALGGIVSAIGFSALPFRAYQLIWDQYYRDQNLQASLDVSLTSGIVSDGERVKLATMRKRAWEKDYFTSALPFSQRGADVSLPIIGDTTDITYKDISLIKKASDGSGVGNNKFVGTGNLDGDDMWAGDPTPAAGEAARIENIDSFSFDATSVTINVLRRAVKLQEWLEKNARGGARYVEQILSHFGVVSSDARLQRCEYLGGGKNALQISEVLSTFQADDGDIPQGNMAGRGISYGKTNGFSKRFEEHGFVIGVMSVLPVTGYQQGFHRMFHRGEKFDYYWPEFAHLGEQEIKNREIYVDPAAVGNWNDTWGYQSRYAEYKYMCSSVHGEFRQSLSYWHMGRIFANFPPLDVDFVTSNPTHRIFPVTDPEVHKLYVSIFNRVDALRPMPYFGTPSF